jgi:para-aminobenzoate synthetase/4-amino-4-deoxychorismate lyase
VINHSTGIATYGVGGGITWDSTTEGEYQEIIAKASLLEENRPEFQLLESLLLNNGELFLFEEHLNRLKQSAKYFGFPFKEDEVKTTLLHFAEQHHSGIYKIRLLLDKSGETNIDGQSLLLPKELLKVTLGDEPLNKDNPFLYQKTTNRAIYDQFRKKFPLIRHNLIIV